MTDTPISHVFLLFFCYYLNIQTLKYESDVLYFIGTLSRIPSVCFDLIRRIWDKFPFIQSKSKCLTLLSFLGSTTVDFFCSIFDLQIIIV